MIDREFPAIRRLLEDLRNLARPIPLERFPVDVVRLLQETAERITPIAAQAGLTVTVSPPAAALAIEGDLFALGRVLQNLLQNALQATPPNGRVWLSTREMDGPRARAGDLATHRRAARGNDRRDERSRQGIGVHAVVPGDPGAAPAAAGLGLNGRACRRPAS